MVSTRSSTRDKKMVVFKEILDYFTKLVEPLVTTERLERKIRCLVNLKRESSNNLKKTSHHRIKK